MIPVEQRGRMHHVERGGPAMAPLFLCLALVETLGGLRCGQTCSLVLLPPRRVPFGGMQP